MPQPKAPRVAFSISISAPVDGKQRVLISSHAADTHPSSISLKYHGASSQARNKNEKAH